MATAENVSTFGMRRVRRSEMHARASTTPTTMCGVFINSCQLTQTPAWRAKRLKRSLHGQKVTPRLSSCSGVAPLTTTDRASAGDLRRTRLLTAVATEGHSTGAHERDQCRQKRVLDQVLAIFLTNETSEQILHYYSPCAGLLNCTGTARAEARRCRQHTSANSSSFSVIRIARASLISRDRTN